MRLKLLAISDTHLGEDTSLLSFPRGRQHLRQVLRECFGEGKNKERFEVEEVVLLGDVTDRTLSSTSQIITHTNAFIQMLGNAADVKKGVFIPGNHEHTLWTDYHRIRDTSKSYYNVTGPDGELIVDKGKRIDKNNSAEELLTIFFGYPSGSSWRNIQDQKKLDFLIANPLYAKKINGQVYAFAHGTHFRRDVTAPKMIKKIADYIELDELLGDIEINSNCDVEKAKNMEELEKQVSRFVDSLWPSSKNNPTSQSDQLWYLLTTLGGKLKKKRDRRPFPANSQYFNWSDLSSQKKRFNRLVDSRGKAKDESIKRWQKHFCAHMLGNLKSNNILKDNDKDIVFVYGDTHNGGWGELQLDSGEKIRIFNTGGWVVHNPKDHPACHMFIIDDNRDQYLLDISFKGVRVGDETLLDLAARDNENHNRNTSRILRMLTNFIFWD